MKKKNESQIRRVAAMLAVERNSDRVVDFCRDAFGVSESGAKAMIKDARALLALAADVDVREELGKRKEQLEDLLERARDAGNLRVELSTIQELSKLCDLYAASNVSNAAAEVESATVALARAHLEGLGIVPKGLPIEELARQIANVIMNGPKPDGRSEVRSRTGSRPLGEKKPAPVGRCPALKRAKNDQK